ncbi:hypothetical protein [Mycolicibacter senuensis]|uniref:Spirocyclase, AveC family n=1 Tax=Mycolicibacter senuensis TaxID=386913 RepID=A0A7I9XQ17_9MYCO|nr:hypothetical protein [Mycolicibacter senuensis]GFG72004.1 hypothetical protein MSEN_37240 [Mycolicibacter senuensis]
MPEPIVADVLAVRLFEVVAFGLFAFGWWYALRTRSMIVLGGYVGATLTVVFDWMFNTKWFFNVLYSSNFIPLFRIGDTVQPVALLFTYAFFFGIPTAFLARNRAWLDRRFGTWGWLVVFLGMGVLQPLFEIPMVSWLHLWTYYQAPQYLVGGVIWSNIWFSGLLGVSCYGALRLALRWEDTNRLPQNPTEDKLRQLATGAAGIWSAFYLSTLVQLMLWYAVVTPWISSPRDF